jgi:FkbM family methyltransferase
MRSPDWRGKALARRLIGSLLEPTGFDLVRAHRVPRNTFLGLQGMPVRSVVDVGANRGQFAREALAVFPTARVYCFEPQPRPFGDLERWSHQTSGSVEVFKMALGESTGVSTMTVHPDWDYSSSLLQTTLLGVRQYPDLASRSSLQVPLSTLDDVFLGGPIALESDILIKIDAQGYDDRVIRGGQKLFGLAQACIVEINLDEIYSDQGTFKDIFSLLDALGYEYRGNLEQTYAADGHVVFIDAVFVRTGGQP